MAEIIKVSKNVQALVDAVQTVDESGTIEFDGEIKGEAGSIVLSKSITLSGKNAAFVGNGVGIVITCSDVTIQNITFDGFSPAILINPFGEKVQNIHIVDCTFKNYVGAGIQTGSSMKGGVLSALTIEGCKFLGGPKVTVNGLSDWEGAPMSVCLSAAVGDGSNPLDNCSVDNAVIKNCLFEGYQRIGINTIPCCVDGHVNDGAPDHYGCSIKNLSIKNNKFSGCYDATVNIMGSISHNVNSLTEHVLIAENKLNFGIWGIYLCANEPLNGSCMANSIKNIRISNNELTLKDGGCGEAACAIGIQSSRLDFGEMSGANDGLVSNIEVSGNIINNAQQAVMINACDAMADIDRGEMRNNIVEKVNITNNQINDCDDCLTVYAAQLEGRRTDVRIGIPPKTLSWMPLLTDNHVTTCLAENNVVKKISFVNNRCAAYKYKYKLAAVNARGHAKACNNRIDDSLTIEDNLFLDGEGHILVEDQVLADWVEAKNNSVTKKYRK